MAQVRCELGVVNAGDRRIGISYAERKRRDAIAERPLPVEEKLLEDRCDHISTREGLRLSAEGNAWAFHMKAPEREANVGEIYNLSIGRGTLTEEHRYRINEHMAQAIVMLESLPWPRHLRRVPEYTGGHHEKMDGTGYPRGLRGEEMSIPARVMAIADIIEALTAADRPYKEPKTLSEALRLALVAVLCLAFVLLVAAGYGLRALLRSFA